MSGGGTVASVANLSLSYGGPPVVKDVSFAVAAGECVCLIGRNGSGKSTLMKGMLGLVPPLSGAVRIEGGLDATAFMPQTQPGGADFPATVWEVALSGCQRARHFQPFYNRSDKELASRTLERLGVADLRHKRISSLSGGQRQRTFLARALCRRPRLLLLDEPYTGLDPEAADSLCRVLDDLRARNGLAVVMSSHDLGAVAAAASRVLVLDRRLLFDGEVKEWIVRFGN
jgi:zinc transport system ATP-binding protein